MGNGGKYLHLSRAGPITMGDDVGIGESRSATRRPHPKQWGRGGRAAVDRGVRQLFLCRRSGRVRKAAHTDKRKADGKYENSYA